MKQEIEKIEVRPTYKDTVTLTSGLVITGITTVQKTRAITRALRYGDIVEVPPVVNKSNKKVANKANSHK